MTRTITLLTAALLLTPAAFAQVVEGTEPNRGGTISVEARDPVKAREMLFPAEGYDVNLFASEQEFPELANPVSLTFDAQGRMFVITMPSYPQRLPDEDPDDKLIILEDTDRDGRADVSKVYADGLHVPTGFELGDGGAYISAQPDIIFVKDTDGDDVADFRETVLHGFGTEDSHHSISAFTWGPDGGLYFQEGTFHHSQVETPYGPVRLVDAGVFRYKPNQWFLEVFVTYRFANPWGHVFDRWGQNFIADASGGSNYVGTAISGYKPYPRKSGGMKVFTSVVRPTAGCEMVRSRHFPDEAQGNFLVNNCIGFQGIKQHKVLDEGSGFTSEEVEPLLYSSDINFRPVDIQFGPDGALYIVDWFNPLIGHMQYSLRDEGRDHSHGRIWRITYKHKPLLEPPVIADASIEQLLDNLKVYENRTRYRTRIELRNRDTNAVAAALEKWVAALDPSHEDYDHHLLEALWVYQTINRVNVGLLDRVLASTDHRARAAATRVARHWRNEFGGALERVAKSATDDAPRVRMEAIVALSYFREVDAAKAVLAALEKPTDYYLDYTLKESIDALREVWKPAIVAGEIPLTEGDENAEYLARQMSSEELIAMGDNPVAIDTLLWREDLSLANRTEAMQRRAALDSATFIETWLNSADTVIKSSMPNRTMLLEDLSAMLLDQSPEELKPYLDQLVELAGSEGGADIREAALIGMMRAEQSVDRAWAMAQQDNKVRLALLSAVPDIPEASLRNALYDPIQSVLKEAEDMSAAGEVVPAAQYIRIELPGEKRVLTVAEVEVISNRDNIAANAKARQSSTGHGGEAKRATDGNRNPTYSGNGQTHTNPETNPWLEIDLGEERPVERVRIWNRNEGDLWKRLDNFTLIALDADRTPVFEQKDNPAQKRSVMIDINADPALILKDAALTALAHVDAGGDETFGQLVDFAESEDQWRTAFESLATLDTGYWQAEGFDRLAAAITARIEAADNEQLTAPALRAAFDIGEKLAVMMPAEQGAALRNRLSAKVVQRRVIRPVPHKMVYDTTEIMVKAGAPVEIVLENIDIMPHNLVVTTPGNLETVGRLADAEAMRPEAAARDYVPVSDEVLFATSLVQPAATEVLRFTAPAEPGEYPFVCTYPGHWLLMRGVMYVMEELPQGVSLAGTDPGAPAGAQRPFVKLWDLYELTPGLNRVNQGRNFANGEALFEAASCSACHAIDPDSDVHGLGPNLYEAGIQYSARDLLRHILEPELEIHEDYPATSVVLNDGTAYVGHVFEENDEELRLRQNLLAPDVLTRVDKANIAQRTEVPQSLMPQGLLVTLTQTDIYDLLAYILSGADAESASFQGAPDVEEAEEEEHASHAGHEHHHKE